MTALPLWLWVILAWASCAVAFLAWLLRESYRLDDARADDLLPTDDLMAVADAVRPSLSDEEFARLHLLFLRDQGADA